MHVIIESPTGTEVERRELGPDEILDCEVFAATYADQCGAELSTEPGHIPNCCGDVRIEFREDPDNHVHIWAGQSFFFK
jgi:hypothetical protein